MLDSTTKYENHIHVDTVLILKLTRHKDVTGTVPFLQVLEMVKVVGGSSEHFNGLDSFCQESRIEYGILDPGHNSGTV